MSATGSALEGVCVIDADTHLTEPHDLWTSRAPQALRERVPRVEQVDGRPTWIVDGEGVWPARGATAIRRDGSKARGTEFFSLERDEIHTGAYTLPDRLATMDEQGIWGQIVYPNAFGFGGQAFLRIADESLRIAIVRLYNDAMADLQEESGGRLMPMAVMPWWDLDEMVAEASRAKGLGLHGVNTSTGPHNHGLPDLGAPHWDPFWACCADLGLPVNFHIGAADSDFAWFGTVSWPSLKADFKLGLGSAMLYLNNAAVVGNLVYAGVLERHPDLQIVSVESGLGWIPFLMEALDYQLGEMSAKSLDALSIAPSEYVRRQVHSCFWFEHRRGIGEAIDALGADHIMFETDYPHPTCTYPDGLVKAVEAVEPFGRDVMIDLLGGNAARLYHIDVPASTASTSSA